MIGSHMIATTMYFPNDLYKKIGQVAKQENKPKAQVVRELVKDCLKDKIGQKGNAKAVFEGLTKLQKLVPDEGPRDLAKNHDLYTWN